MNIVIFLGFLYLFFDYIIENERAERRKRNEQIRRNKRKIFKIK